MKYKHYAALAAGLAFGLASCSEATKTEQAPPEETPAKQPAAEVAPAESTPTEQAPAEEAITPATPVAMSDVANQLSGKLVRYDAATESFIEAKVDGSIDYYIVSLSASW